MTRASSGPGANCETVGSEIINGGSDAEAASTPKIRDQYLWRQPRASGRATAAAQIAKPVLRPLGRMYALVRAPMTKLLQCG
mmetsp:Transcript_107461/g.285896  ORF Transcript_107461/g.285896 Transcript_107461/m.285896 type:complete len:82 (+) Transcript_107461:199-444(+)